MSFFFFFGVSFLSASLTPEHAPSHLFFTLREPKQPNYCVQPSQTPPCPQEAIFEGGHFFFPQPSTDRVLGQLRLTESCEDSEPGIWPIRLEIRPISRSWMAGGPRTLLISTDDSLHCWLVAPSSSSDICTSHFEWVAARAIEADSFLVCGFAESRERHETGDEMDGDSKAELAHRLALDCASLFSPCSFLWVFNSAFLFWSLSLHPYSRLLLFEPWFMPSHYQLLAPAGCVGCSERCNIHKKFPHWNIRQD